MPDLPVQPESLLLEAANFLLDEEENIILEVKRLKWLFRRICVVIMDKMKLKRQGNKTSGSKVWGRYPADADRKHEFKTCIMLNER